MSSPLNRWIDSISTMHLTIGLSVASLLVMVFGTVSAYSSPDRLPHPGPPPPRPESSAVTTYRYLPTFYRSLIEDDAKKVGAKAISVATLARGNAYRLEFSGAQKLGIGKKLETTSLAITAVAKRLWVGEEGSRFRAKHVILRIANRTKKHLAYRVITEVAGRCKAKAILPQNAMALAPEATVERTECLVRGAKRLEVKKVEVLELTALGYHYVTRLDPSALGYASRTSEGHDNGKLSSCRLLPWRRIKQDLSADEATWYDIVDFYSRHNCDEYSYISGYHWSKKGPGKKLPIKPPG